MCWLEKHDYKLTYSFFSGSNNSKGRYDSLHKREVQFTCKVCGKIKNIKTIGLSGSGCLEYFKLTKDPYKCECFIHPSDDSEWGIKK